VSPSPRAALALAAIAVLTVLVGPLTGVLLAVALVGATLADAFAVRARPRIERRVPPVLARGLPAPLTVEAAPAGAGSVRVRQPVPPDLAREPREADGGLRATLTPLRRGRHTLGPVAARTEGPLRLGRWHHTVAAEQEVLVYPNLPAARRIALAVRQGRFRETGRLTRGPLGLGTDFESIRDYAPDDDVRQINWRATDRTGRPMSNQYRVEQDRDVMLVVDAGRLSAAPLPGEHASPTVLDACLDALTAVALVADEVGDRCGAIAFDSEVRAALRPGRAQGAAVVRALFDLEPRPTDSDFELAFQRIQAGKRAFVLVLCDLLEEAAARPLVEAMPVLARRHAVVVASPTDPELARLVATEPHTAADLARAAVATEVAGARARAAALVRAAGASVLEAPAERLPRACVAGYLRAKARARV
jgi:uncharacterized protein (DUF58 family)